MVIAEIVDLEQAFLHQCAQAVIRFAQADAELLSEFALVNLRVGFQSFQDFVAVFVGKHCDLTIAFNG